MEDRRKHKLTLGDVLKGIFKYRDIEFADFKFTYWREFEGYGEPEPVPITDLSNGLLDGKYSLTTDTAQISNIDKVPIKILDFCAMAIFKENKWYGITYTSTTSNEEYWSHPGLTIEDYFKNRESKIKENIEEALKILSLFFNRYK